MSMADDPAKQTESEPKRIRGKFAPGSSGNPNGRRPKGLATVEKLRTALADELPGIIEAVVKKAKEGDTGACKLILERVLPPLKAAEMPVECGELAGTLSEQGHAILRSMAEGVLSPTQAAQLIGALAAQARVVEVDEIERRLAALEQRATPHNHAASVLLGTQK